MELKDILILIVIVGIISLMTYGCMNNLKLSEIRRYTYLESNGQTYQTDEIEDITRDYIHNKETFILVMEDGSKIYINDYSLHD